MGRRKNDGSSAISCVNGRYRRTIGRWRDTSGKVAAKTFYLGKDYQAAVVANARLEKLWALIERETKAFNARREVHIKYPPAAPEGPEAPEAPEPERQPLWGSMPPEIIAAVRKGEMSLPVEPRKYEGIDEAADSPASYSEAIHDLNVRFRGIIAFHPSNPEAFKRGQDDWAEHQKKHLRRAAHSAAVANLPAAAASGWTLHRALERYAEACRQEDEKESKRKEAEAALRHKQALEDLPLEQFDYNAITRMVGYWKRRPESRRRGGRKTGKPIAVATVIGQIKTLRRFVRWMHRNSEIPWRQPEDVAEALHIEPKRLLTESEIARSSRGPQTWTAEELTILYAYATDLERVLLLFGVNLGYAQSECESFRIDDIQIDAQPPHIDRVRRKTHNRFQAALWPETVAALQWLAEQRRKFDAQGNEYVLLSDRGKRLNRQGIANRWNGLLDRVQKDHPEFRRLSYKQLRKTAYQFVREASDGETAGVFQGRSKVNSDEFADAYGRRDFEKVFAANQQVRDRLADVFATDQAQAAFTMERGKRKPNISVGTAAKIQRLQADGVAATEIARAADVSTSTVYRHARDTRSPRSPRRVVAPTLVSFDPSPAPHSASPKTDEADESRGAERQPKRTTLATTEIKMPQP